MPEGITSARLHILRLNAGRLNHVYAIAAPHPPILIAPPDGAVQQSLTPFLDWMPDPRDYGPFTYDLYLGIDPNPPLVAAGWLPSEYQALPLLGSAEYFWRVVVRNPAVGAPAPDYAAAVRADGASNYWRLNESAGTQAVDQVGGKHGTISGGVTLNQPGALLDPANRAMTFDGATGRITTAPTTVVAPLTFEMWFSTAFKAGENPFFGAFDWPWGGANGSDDDAFSVRVTGGAVVLYEITRANVAAGVQLLKSGMDDGRWHHLVIVFLGGSGVAYIDGTPVSISGSLRFAGFTNRGFEIGWYAAGALSFNGAVDEVAIYPYALNAAQIANHYRIGTVAHVPALPASSPVWSFATGPRYASIIIGGVDVTIDHVSANTPVRYDDGLNNRSTISLTLDTTVGAFPELDGAELVALDGNTRVFGGMILEPEERVSAGTDRVVITCQGSDYSGICDRRLVARAYSDQDLRDIVVSIVRNDLTEEGIDVSGVEQGPRILKAIFNWRTVTEAFNQLAELTGFTWRIDPHRVLQFHARGSRPAQGPFTPERVGSISVRPDRQMYRNHQVLRFSGGLTDPRTESFVGDGKRQTFTLAFAAGTVPRVTVDGVPKTVGIKGVEQDRQWYWNKGNAELTQDDALPPLAVAQVLAVAYQGLFDGIISAADGAEVSRRRAIEGGSGRYMHVEERGASTQTTEAAIQVAQATLDRYGTIGRVLTCQTEIPGYAPGQLVTVHLPDYGIDDEQFLIESVSGEIPTGNDSFWYTIRALSGDPYGGWQTYFRRLQSQRRDDYVLNENDVVIGLNQWAETLVVHDAALTVAAGAPGGRIGVGRIGLSTVGGV